MSGSEFSAGTDEFAERASRMAGTHEVKVPSADSLRIGPSTQQGGDLGESVPEPQVHARASEAAGRAAVKGVAEQGGASTSASATETTRQYVVPSVEDVLSGRSADRSTEHGEVLEGTIVDKSGQAFDKPLSEEQQVLLVGKHARDMDESAGEILKTRMETWHKEDQKIEQRGEEPRRREVLAAHFKPGFESVLERRDPEWYHARTSSGVEGFLRALTPKQLSEAVAKAATRDDPGAFRATHDVMRTVVKALQTEERDPETKELIDVKPPLAQELREGMVYYRDGRYDPKDPGKYPEATWQHLSPEQISNLKHAKIKSVMDRNGAARDATATFLETAFDPDDMTAARTNHENASATNHVLDPRDAGNRVRITHVGANGFGTEADELASVLAHALPFAVGPNSALGMPDALYMSGVENAPADAVKQILDTCRAQNIPVIMTATEMTPEMAQILSGSAVGASEMTPVMAGVVSGMLDTARREFTKSGALSWSGGDATSKDGSLNKNFDVNPDIPSSVAESNSNNNSTNEGFNVTWTTEVDPNAALASPAELRLVRRGQMVVFGSGGELHGLHDRATRGWMAPFPPPDQKPYAEFLQLAEDRFRALAGKVLHERGLGLGQHQAVTEGALGMSAIEGPGAVAERSQPTFEIPAPNGGTHAYSMRVQYGRPTWGSDRPDVRSAMRGKGQREGYAALNELKAEYSQRYRVSYNRDTADFGRFCVLRYVQGVRQGNIGNVPLMEWAERSHVQGYVNRHLRMQGYDVNDPYFWHNWLQARPKCVEWLREYQPAPHWS